MSNWFADVRYAARTLRKSPAFTAAAILTLALGISANSAIFTLIDAVLLRPLPFPQPDRLVLVWEETKIFGLKDSPVALGNYAAWREQNRVFGEMGALEQRSFRLTGGADAQQVDGSLATAGLFRALGVRPALGRLFGDEEDRPRASKVVVLSDGLWRGRYGGVAGVLNTTTTINDEKCTIVGVMPAGFRFPGIDNDLWMPLGSYYPASEFSNRGRHNFMVVARLLPGASLPRANQEIRAIAARMEHDYPDTNYQMGAFVAPLREHFAGEQRGELLVLGCAVGFVLLIACANITNLLLSRAANRKREMAIRAALGAGRFRVVRQLFTENLLIAAAGGGCGLLIAVISLRLLQRLVPSGISAMRPVTVDLRILGFTLAASLLTGLLVGVAPALQLVRADIQGMLKRGGGRTGTGHAARGVERALVIAEVALAFVLTLGAALMMQTFARLRGVDPGFRTSHVLTLITPLPRAKYGDQARLNAYYDSVLGRLTSLPGVVSAGFANHLPIAFTGDVNGFTVEGRPEVRGQYTNANWRVITPGYLRTLGIPLRQGRSLDRNDTAEAPSVLLVNETMQSAFWPGESAVGKRIRMGPDWSTIVGVVGDIKQAALDAPPKREMYFPAAQVPRGATALAIHTAGDPARLTAAVVREIRAVDPDLPITQGSTMDEILDREVGELHVQTTLLTLFATVALVLASLGIYGVLAYAVAQRTQEIGIRMALGARPADVLLSITAQGVGWSAVGILIGMAGGLALTRLLAKMLFGISATDPATFGAAAALLMAVAWAASYVPARRAMKLDPIVALREE